MASLAPGARIRRAAGRRRGIRPGAPPLVAVGARRGARRPWAAHGGGAGAAQRPARTELDAPAGSEPRGARRRHHHRRRPGSAGDAARARPARSARRARHLLLHRRAYRAAPAAGARDRRAPPRDRQSQLPPPGAHGLSLEIGRTQQAIHAATGQTALFFRAPAGLRNPFLEPVLARANLRLVSWTRRGFDTVTADPERVLARLTRRLAGGDILLLHDGHAARTPQGTAVILAVLPRLLAGLRAAQLNPVTLRDTLTAAAPAP